jgi:hypothetical protein
MLSRPRALFRVAAFDLGGKAGDDALSQLRKFVTR